MVLFQACDVIPDFCTVIKGSIYEFLSVQNFPKLIILHFFLSATRACDAYNPCQNGATCIAGTGDDCGEYTCQCPSCWTGPLCDQCKYRHLGIACDFVLFKITEDIHNLKILTA